MMWLTTQFRVLGSDGTQHSIACYSDHHDAPSTPGLYFDHANVFRLNGAENVARLDDDTFVTEQGHLLRRLKRAG